MYSMPQKSSLFLVKLAVSRGYVGAWASSGSSGWSVVQVPFWRWESKVWEYPGLQQECSAGPCQEGHRGRVSSAAVAGQRSGALLRPPALEAMRRVEGFLPGGAVQVSSPAAEKASVPVLCREPGLTGSSSTTCIRDRVKQQIMLLKRTINRLLVVKEKAFRTENR